MEMQYIIYMQEACGPLHIDHYRSKLCSLYTSNDQLCVLTETSRNVYPLVLTSIKHTSHNNHKIN